MIVRRRARHRSVLVLPLHGEVRVVAGAQVLTTNFHVPPLVPPPPPLHQHLHHSRRRHNQRVKGYLTVSKARGTMLLMISNRSITWISRVVNYTVLAAILTVRITIVKKQMLPHPQREIGAVTATKARATIKSLILKDQTRHDSLATLEFPTPMSLDRCFRQSHAAAVSWGKTAIKVL